MGLSGNDTQVRDGKERSIVSSRPFAERDCSLHRALPALAGN